MEKIKKNLRYKVGCNGIENRAIFQKSYTTDRSYMNAQMKRHLDYLDKHGISEYQNFVKILHNYLLSAHEILKLIEAFIDFKNKQNLSNNIILLKPREMKKTNSGEKNILLNRLAVEFSTEFMHFFENYICFFYPLMKTKNKLIQEFKNKIDILISRKNIKTDDVNMISSNENNKLDSINILDSTSIKYDTDLSEKFFIFTNNEPYDAHDLFQNETTFDNIFDDASL